MAFLSEEELKILNLKAIGSNVKISSKASIYNADDIEIGNNSRIDDYCVLSGKIKIGNNVHIAVYCNVAGGSEGIVFHDFSGLAYGCHVFTQTDDYTGVTMTNPTVPSEYKNERKMKIVIGKHAIVGTNSLIFPGVTISEGTAIGAMTMVTRSTREWSVYFGVPAKYLKPRKRDLLKLEREYMDTLRPR